MSDELIQRLKDASEGSRELDALIWSACDPEGIRLTAERGSPESASSFKYGCDGFVDKKPNLTLRTYRGPAYTTSIDAAMTLANNVYVRMHIAPDGIADVLVDGTQGCGATPALALCLASLAARGEK